MTVTITATKTSRTLQSSTSNSASGTTTGSALDLTTKLGPHLISGIVTNGGTGPTVGCDFVIETSRDNSNWIEFSRQTAGVTNSQAYSFNVNLSIGVLYVRAKFTGNTGQAVTVEAYLQELTSLSAA